MSGLTPKLPLAYGSENGTYLLIKSYKELVKQNFKNLIMTSPGERMMDPQFGVGIRNFLFENDSPSLYADINSAIVEQSEKYMPFISIVDVRFLSEEQFIDMYSNSLIIQIEYLIGPLAEVDNLSITVPGN